MIIKILMKGLTYYYDLISCILTLFTTYLMQSYLHFNELSGVDLFDVKDPSGVELHGTEDTQEPDDSFKGAKEYSSKVQEYSKRVLEDSFCPSVSICEREVREAAGPRDCLLSREHNEVFERAKYIVDKAVKHRKVRHFL